MVMRGDRVETDCTKTLHSSHLPDALITQFLSLAPCLYIYILSGRALSLVLRPHPRVQARLLLLQALVDAAVRAARAVRALVPTVGVAGVLLHHVHVLGDGVLVPRVGGHAVGCAATAACLCFCECMHVLMSIIRLGENALLCFRTLRLATLAAHQPLANRTTIIPKNLKQAAGAWCSSHSTRALRRS